MHLYMLAMHFSIRKPNKLVQTERNFWCKQHCDTLNNRVTTKRQWQQKKTTTSGQEATQLHDSDNKRKRRQPRLGAPSS